MFYIQLTLSITATVISLYICLNTLIRGFRFAVNRLFALISFATAVLNVSLTYQILFPGSPHGTGAARIYLAMISLVAQLYFHYTQIFPRWEKRAPGWVIAVTAVPGLAMLAAALFWDGILASAGIREGQIHYTFGAHFYLYYIVFGFNILGALITSLYKARVLENEAFRIQFFYRSFGDLTGAFFIIAGFIVFPLAFNDQRFHPIGISMGFIMLAVINYYALSDERLLDFRRFYLRVSFWVTIFLLLFVPAYFIVRHVGVVSIAGQGIPLLGVTLLVFFYFVVAFRLIAPRVENMFSGRYLLFERNINEFFQGLSGASDTKNREGYWDIFFETTIDPLGPRFGIVSVALFMRNPRDGSFLYTHGFGESVLTTFEAESDIVRCLNEFPRLLERSMLYTDERLSAYRAELRPFFASARLQVALPFFNHENTLIGIMLLGDLDSKKPYPIELINALDMYRIHFELTLANSLYLEEIAETQISEHDRMVVKSVKNRIIPKKMAQVQNIRISSLFLDNSDYGGDYFDSIAVKNQNLGIFMTDTSNAGIASALLALEFYTVLHTHGASCDSPEKLLNLLNWVTTTSRFSDSKAPAFYCIFSSSTRALTYANASMNPLVLFDANRETFAELNTGGDPIGMDKAATYEARSVQTMPGFIGTLFSRGLTELTGPEGTTYSTGRVKDIIRLNRNDSPALLIRKIYDDLKGFLGETKLMSDISLIVFRVE
ncbi:MAG TPA: hypothetical protein ENN21_00660 [Spirochaetes bacterium]|nr:hypothetical protein [Spirochaetota bacterium]